ADVVAAQMDDLSLGGDQRSGRRRVRRPILAPDLVEHQLRVVVELDREPVPTLLVLAQRGAAELVVHPRQSAAVPAVDGSTCVAESGVRSTPTRKNVSSKP